MRSRPTKQSLFAGSLAVLGWFGVLSQYTINLSLSQQGFVETSLKFFGYFTILSNTAAAAFFTLYNLPPTSQKLRENGFWLGGVLIYISVVGIIFHILLSNMYKPVRLAFFVNHVLHTIMPLGVLVFWMNYAAKLKLDHAMIPKWLIFPAGYLAYVLIIGAFFDHYPYFFMDLSLLSPGAFVLNVILVGIFFAALGYLLVQVSGLYSRRKH